MPIILKLKVDQIFFRKLTNKTRRFLTWTESRTEQRLAEHNDLQVDIFQSIRKAKDPVTENGLTSAELNSEVITVIVAGKLLHPPRTSARCYPVTRAKAKTNLPKVLIHSQQQ